MWSRSGATLQRGPRTGLGRGPIPRAVAMSRSPVSPPRMPAPSLAGPSGFRRRGGAGVRAQELAREGGQPVAAE